jgi:hypothetical protein
MTFKRKVKKSLLSDMEVQAYNSSTWEAEAGGLQVQGQPGLYNETLSQNNNKQKVMSKE